MKTNPMMRLLAENKGKGKFEIKAQADNPREAVVYLYDAIVSTEYEADWYGGVSAESFVKQINALDVDTIKLRINSPGGSVFAARAMETALRNHKAKVIAYIDGLAASAASFLAMVADEIEMAQGSFFMIHKAWTVVWGDADEMLKATKLLEKLDGTLATTYHNRTGIDESELLQMMAAETWMEASEAVAKGFADRVVSDNKTAENHWQLGAYNHAPAVPTNQVAAPEPQPDRAALRRSAMVAIAGA
ncbi:Clp protease ClpP [Neisseria weixii]|uniref:ATP-dependent Clp protease proteolytic subunit n=1 Tax=Neisseria weixii TaxID=1853276 RepID=A0A3N4N5P0_9NEIS|nr:head maturation protease, ClpP-related [Neisseria weixii]RPD90508.1 Clp protease ClpP [Neisseria weixii]RPD90550.1 Clp protease ClpP [Neisseria weixii]